MTSTTVNDYVKEMSSVLAIENHPNIKSILVVGDLESKNARKFLNEYIIEQLHFQQYAETEESTRNKIFYISKNWSSLSSQNADDITTVYQLVKVDMDKDMAKYERVRVVVQLDIDIHFDNNFNRELFEKLICLFDYIFVVSSTAEQYYLDCMLNRVKPKMFSDTYFPAHSEGMRYVVECLKKISSEKLLVVDGIDDNAFMLMIAVLEHSSNTFLRQSGKISLEEVLNRIPTQQPSIRNNQYIQKLVVQEKYQLKRFYEPLVSSWVSCLKNRNASKEEHEKCVDEILLKFKCRHSLTTEANTALKELLSSVSSGPSAVQLIIAHAVNALELNMNESTVQRLISIANCLTIYCTHYVFKHRVLNDVQFVPLLAGMLRSECVKLKLAANELVAHTLKSDYKRYGSKFIEYDKTSGRDPFPRLLFEFIMTMAERLFELFERKHELQLKNESLSEEDEKQLKVAMDINNSLSLPSLVLLLKGSPENCSKLTHDDYRRLLQLVIRPAVYSSQNELKYKLFFVLKTINQYGLSKENAHYLNKVFQLVLMNLYKVTNYSLTIENPAVRLKNLLKIYKELFVFVEYYRGRDENHADWNGEQVKETEQREVQPFDQEKTNAAKCLLESYVRLKAGKKESCYLLSEKQTMAQLMIDKNELKDEVEKLKRELTKTRKREEQLSVEIKDLLNDRKQLKDQLETAQITRSEVKTYVHSVSKGIEKVRAFYSLTINFRFTVS